VPSDTLAAAIVTEVTPSVRLERASELLGMPSVRL
jgi:hypothetical protein